MPKKLISLLRLLRALRLEQIHRIIGIGGKLQANYNITNRLGFSIGSKLMVVDYFSRNISYGQIEPNQFDFIRDDVVLQMGFVFNF